MKKTFPRILVFLLLVFALLTLFLSSSVIFDLFGIRAKEGNYVLFIIWANFICSMIYLAAAYGLIKRESWPYKILGLAAFILIIAFVGLFFHINHGGLYETKTIGAMVFRIGVTLLFMLFCHRWIKKEKQASYLHR